MVLQSGLIFSIGTGRVRQMPGTVWAVRVNVGNEDTTATTNDQDPSLLRPHQNQQKPTTDHHFGPLTPTNARKTAASQTSRTKKNTHHQTIPPTTATRHQQQDQHQQIPSPLPQLVLSPGRLHRLPPPPAQSHRAPSTRSATFEPRARPHKAPLTTPEGRQP